MISAKLPVIVNGIAGQNMKELRTEVNVLRRREINVKNEMNLG
jgi:hypothetical protein